MIDNVFNYGDSLYFFMGIIGILFNQKGIGSILKVDGVDFNYYNGIQLMNIMDILFGLFMLVDIVSILFSFLDEDVVRIVVLDIGVDIIYSGVSDFIY